MIKVTGKTSGGRASCGHRVKAGESYFLVQTNRGLFSVCEKCVSGKVKIEKFIKIPEDLVNGLISV